ncbi:hypothetical protein OGAPHI_002346 [Ogataea philodendri]|uniref:Aminopeptidase n=1 Tax=Ogataea philodendri TaxID=1378263 RepID=A0A9P8PC60_9ASCO|nr:uncharacterized protein OGAPHI_002346 [Ogataea philodendri]KAH3668592.1 hypothetical protein OGAPHI_002346 [Ogataea philodendri]
MSNANSSSKDEPLIPMVSLAFSNSFLPWNYDLSFEITPIKSNYLGVAVIDLAPNERADADEAGPLELVFNAVETVITAAYIATNSGSEVSEYKLKVEQNRKTETVKFSTDSLTIGDLSKEKIIRLRVHFIGVVRAISSFKDFTKGVFKSKYKFDGEDKYIISTQCQPSFARSIFPCVDDLLVKASFKLSITTDPDYICVSNTATESSHDLDDQRKLVVFERTPPMTTSVFAFTVGAFDYSETSVELPNQSRFPIKIYTKHGEANRANFAISTVESALPKIVGKFGVDYPISKLDIVALPFLSDGGVENWSMIQILMDHLLTPDTDSPTKILDITNMIKNVLVHEMVHMYMGNLVTYDSYDHTWLNEAFATFMSNTILNEESVNDQVWFDQLNNDGFNMKRYQGLESMKPIHVQNVPADTIHSTFSKHSYDKGIFLLRMLASLFNDTPSENYDNFFKAVGEFIEQNKFGLFKPVDLWNFLKNSSLNKHKYDIPTIMYSWTRTAGYPILSVTNSGEKLVVEQHRFLYNTEAKVEDVPYHVPLFVKDVDGQISKYMLTDRRIEIEAGLLVNANSIAIATVKYSLPQYKSIAKNFDKLNSTEQAQVLLDLSTIFSESYQTKDDLLGFVLIINRLSKNAKIVNATALNIALTLLTTFVDSVISISYFKDEKVVNTVRKWRSRVIGDFISQFEWDGLDFRQLPATELSVRNSLLTIDYSNPQSQSIAKKLYKTLLHGPKGTIPLKLLGAILNNVQTIASAKEYKEILALVKNPHSVTDNIYESEIAADVRTAALTSLGYVTKSDLQQRTLNYVLNNMDQDSVEFSLIGLKHQPESFTTIWSWFSMNYNGFYAKFLKDSDKQIFIKAFRGIVQLVFESCLCSKDLTDKLEAFLKAKKFEILNGEYKRIQSAFQDRVKLNEANSELATVMN